MKAGDTLAGSPPGSTETNHDLVVLIEQANGMADATIHPGQSLTIPPAPPGTGSTTATVTPKATATATPKATSSATPKASASPTK